MAALLKKTIIVSILLVVFCCKSSVCYGGSYEYLHGSSNLSDFFPAPECNPGGGSDCPCDISDVGFSIEDTYYALIANVNERNTWVNSLAVKKWYENLPNGCPISMSYYKFSGEFKIPVIPSTNINQLENGQAVEMSIQLWDGRDDLWEAGKNSLNATAYWMLNAWYVDYGKIMVFDENIELVDTGIYLEPDTEWHSFEMVADYVNKKWKSITIDGQTKDISSIKITPIPHSDWAASNDIALGITLESMSTWPEYTCTTIFKYTTHFRNMEFSISPSCDTPDNNFITVNKHSVGPEHPTGYISASSGDILFCEYGGPCSGLYLNGTTVTLTAVPTNNGTFTGWSGVDCASGSQNLLTCTVTSNTDLTLNAYFSKYYKFHLSNNGVGSGNIHMTESGVTFPVIIDNAYSASDNITSSGYWPDQSSGTAASKGTVVELSAQAVNNSWFEGWEGVNCSGGNNSQSTCQFTFDDRLINISAAFNNAHLEIVKTGTGSGYVYDSVGVINGCGNGGACNYIYVKDTAVTLTAVPTGGAAFGGWSGQLCNGASNGLLTCSLTMDSPRNITATFNAPTSKDYYLIIDKCGTGTGTVTSNDGWIDCGASCKHTYSASNIVTLTATAGTNSLFMGWEGGCNDSNNTCTVIIDENMAINGCFDITTDHPVSDLAITKVTDKYNPPNGGTLNFLLTVTNNGPDDATGVKAVDQLPSGFTYLTDNSSGSYDSKTGVWKVGSLSNGASETLIITAMANSSSCAYNAAYISKSNSIDNNSVNDSGFVPLNCSGENTADLSISKTSNNNPLVVGEEIVYSISTKNLGPGGAYNVLIVDILPTEITGQEYLLASSGNRTFSPWTGMVSLGTYNANSSKLLWLRGIVSSLPDDNTLSNTAAISSDTYDTNYGSNSSTDETLVLSTIQTTDLSILKDIDKSSASGGENVVISIIVTNEGPNDADNVMAGDRLPYRLDYITDDSGGNYDLHTGLWSVGHIASGSRSALNITTSLNKARKVRNTAKIVRADTRDMDKRNNTHTIVINDPDKKNDKQLSSTLTALGGANTSSLSNGDSVQFDVTIDNLDTDSTDMQLNITIPSGMSITSTEPSVGCYDTSTNIWYIDDSSACSSASSISKETNAISTRASSDSASLTLEIEVTDDSQITQASIIASLYDDGTDSDITNNSSSTVVNQTDTYVVDLALQLYSDIDTVESGDEVVFTVIVRNNGPDSASSVEINVELGSSFTYYSSDPSQGTYSDDTEVWSVGSLDEGDVETLEITAIVSTSSMQTRSSSTLTSSISLDSVSEGEINSDNDTDSATLTMDDDGDGGSDGGGDDPTVTPTATPTSSPTPTPTSTMTPTPTVTPTPTPLPTPVPIVPFYPSNMGDLNGDGSVDVVGLSDHGGIYYTSDQMTWNNIPGQLSQALVADIDLDGKDDIIGMNTAGDGQVYVTTNLGQSWKSLAGWLESLTTGDIDGDGQLDIIGCTNSGDVWYTLNVMDDQPEWHYMQGNLTQIVITDMDNDGNKEIFGINENGSGDMKGSIWYTVNPTDSVPTWTRISGILSSVNVGDIDGDGKVGMIGINNYGVGEYKGSVWYTANPTSTDPLWIMIPGQLSTISVGDLDGDGSYDLVGLNGYGQGQYKGSIWYMVQVKKGVWTRIDGHLSEIVAGDVDNDGKADLFGINEYDKGSVWYMPSPFSSSPGGWIFIPGYLSNF